MSDDFFCGYDFVPFFFKSLFSLNSMCLQFIYAEVPECQGGSGCMLNSAQKRVVRYMLIVLLLVRLSVPGETLAVLCLQLICLLLVDIWWQWDAGGGWGHAVLSSEVTS